VSQINSRIRLVRLRPEFAALYPGLDPRVWETASDIAARLLVHHGAQPGPGRTPGSRMLPDEHFEFQGGDRREGRWKPSRATDTARLD
jgi:hypothetical protein